MSFWKKSYFIIGALFVTSQSYALTCNGGFHGWSFAGVSIESKVVTCSYRSCYYGCTYDSYTLEGCFKPSNGPWDDGHCGSSSSTCQFTTTDCDAGSDHSR